MFNANSSMHRFPDDPMRVAPPYEAPGEIEPPEPRPPSAAQRYAMRCKIEQEVLACLKGERDFLAYDKNGCLNTWTPYELWTVLINDMKEDEIAATLAAVLDYRGFEKNDFTWDLRCELEREIIDPFVSEQVNWRVEFASEEAMEEWT